MENAGIAADGFTPFALQAGRGGRTLTRFAAGDGSNLADCQAAGREALLAVDADVTCVALAWDGYHTAGGSRSEAVFVEGYEIGQDAGVLLAQRYTRGGDGLVLEGNPMLIDEPTPLVRERREAD